MSRQKRQYITFFFFFTGLETGTNHATVPAYRKPNFLFLFLLFLNMVFKLHIFLVWHLYTRRTFFWPCQDKKKKKLEYQTLANVT